MGINGGVASCAGKVFILAISNMKTSARITVFFSETVINKEQLNGWYKKKTEFQWFLQIHFKKRKYLVTMTTNAHQKIIRFDVPVNEVFWMDVLYAANHLISKHKNSFHREPARAEIKQIF